MADLTVTLPPERSARTSDIAARADEPIWDIIELLFFAYRDFVGDPDHVLEKFGFGRAHHRVLHFINRNPGIKVADLLVILKITKQSLGRVLKQLVDEGYVAQREGAKAVVDGDITPLGNGVCEMNRLWVRPAGRRTGVGRALAQASIDAARELGFTRILCDVAPSRTHAIAMYRALGFSDAPPAHDYPFEMVFLARDL